VLSVHGRTSQAPVSQILGALGRSNTYQESAPENVRATLRHALRKMLKDIVVQYKHSVDDRAHAAHIRKIANAMTSEFSGCLRGGRLRIGIAQKSLNLYLKYLWCVGDIPMPPHCPFDSVVMACLPEPQRVRWTSIHTTNRYMALVKAARAVAGAKSLAKWELEVWARRAQRDRPRPLLREHLAAPLAGIRVRASKPAQE
jgi:hypothetical protein